MNCLEFRRRLLTDPKDNSLDFLQHRQECLGCAAEAEKINDLDERLLRALRVEVPEGLSSRVLLNRSTQGRPSRTTPLRLAWAASLLLSVGVAGWLGYHWHDIGTEYPPLETAVLEHVNSELEHLVVDDDVADDQLRALLAGFGLDLRRHLGQVRYAGKCHVRRYEGVHLVLAGEKGPVTVLLLPREPVSRRAELHSSRFAGLILPLKRGSMAILGEDEEPLHRTAEKIERSLVWL